MATSSLSVATCILPINTRVSASKGPTSPAACDKLPDVAVIDHLPDLNQRGIEILQRRFEVGRAPLQIGQCRGQVRPVLVTEQGIGALHQQSACFSVAAPVSPSPSNSDGIIVMRGGDSSLGSSGFRILPVSSNRIRARPVTPGNSAWRLFRSSAELSLTEMVTRILRSRPDRDECR